MPFLISIVPVCPMRTTASHRAEQVSQLMFGDVAEIIETSGDFVLVKHTYDDYEGWCQRNQLAEFNTQDFDHQQEKLTTEYINEVTINNKCMHIPLGCNVGHLDKAANWDFYNIEYKGKSVNPRQYANDRDFIKHIAMQYLNTAYQWGGRSVFGTDCSGFTQMIFRFVNIPLLRDAYQQASQGEAIGFLEEVGCGDLAFFDNEEGKITHVGILLSATEIIHASGRVRIDTIDHQGIVSSETGLRTHKLRVLKRLIP